MFYGVVVGVVVIFATKGIIPDAIPPESWQSLSPRSSVGDCNTRQAIGAQFYEKKMSVVFLSLVLSFR